MADIPTRSIAQLPIASSVGSNDTSVIQQNGITKSATIGQINQAPLNTLNVWTAKQTFEAGVSTNSFNGLTVQGWTSFTPTVSALSGDFTQAGGSGISLLMQGCRKVIYSLHTVSVGTGNGLRISLPSTPASGGTLIGFDTRYGRMVGGRIASGNPLVSIVLFDGTNPVADNNFYSLEGFYQE